MVQDFQFVSLVHVGRHFDGGVYDRQSRRRGVLKDEDIGAEMLTCLSSDNENSFREGYSISAPL